jgi:hypothetical protein
MRIVCPLDDKIHVRISDNFGEVVALDVLEATTWAMLSRS